MFRELTEAEQATLRWMDEVCGAALAEARQQNLGLLTHLAKHPALQFYINNVVTRNVLTREQFVRQYPAYISEAQLVHEDYLAKEKLKESEAKQGQLESDLADLRKLVEAQAQALAALQEAKKPARGKKTEDAVEDSEDA